MGHFSIQIYANFSRQQNVLVINFQMVMCNIYREKAYQYSSAANHILAAGFHHVVYRLGIGIRHSALTEDEPEAQPSPYAGVGKRK